METKDTQIEGLDEIVERYAYLYSLPYSIRSYVESLLADPAILAHIPAVKALQEQLEFTKQQVTGEVENAGYFKERYQDMQSLADKQSQRIATLEATNAAHAEQLAKLEAELETERLRLAACSVAALGYFDGCKDEYRSASLEDVLRLVDHIFTLKTRLSEIKPGRVGASGMLHPAYVEGYNYAAEQVQEALLQSSTPAEAQLAGGEPVALKVHRGELCYKSTSDDQSYGMWCPVNYDSDHGFPEGTSFYTRPTQSVSANQPDSGGEWQPIETAPKDGSKVLLGHAQWPMSREGGFHNRVGCYVNDFDHPGAHLPHCEYWGHGSDNVLPIRPQPTHWMPLPPAPVDSVEAKS